MRKRWLLAALPLLLAALVALLLFSESAAPEATITSVPSALWYLLTTLTTVGYGDCYPVTAGGRAVGAVLQVMSIGLLGLLIGLLASYLRTAAWERLRLSLLSGKTWYIFSEKNEASLCLAEALAKEGRKRVLLFAKTKDDVSVGRASVISAEELCRRKKNGDFCLFCVAERDTENEILANSVENGRVYCKSACFTERITEHRERFDPVEICARAYWNRFPLRSPEETILLIGDGRWAEAILLYGLLRNILDPAQHVRYVCAGDYSDFLRRHPQIERVLEVDRKYGGKDELRFLTHWDENPALLESADRIVFCGCSEEQTRRVLTQLRRCFAVTGAVHARLSAAVDGAECFGAANELYTPELVMRASLSELAVELNERYRKGNPDAPEWNDLSDFARRSNLAAADHFMTKVRVLAQKYGAETALKTLLERYRNAAPEEKDRYRRIEHARWCRFHYLNGWRYGERRDNEKRLHPLLVPFDRLNPAEQEKDDYGWETVIQTFMRKTDEK